MFVMSSYERSPESAPSWRLASHAAAPSRRCQDSVYADNFQVLAAKEHGQQPDMRQEGLELLLLTSASGRHDHAANNGNILIGPLSRSATTTYLHGFKNSRWKIKLQLEVRISRLKFLKILIKPRFKSLVRSRPRSMLRVIEAVDVQHTDVRFQKRVDVLKF